MMRRLVKRVTVDVNDQSYAVSYFSRRTRRGTPRYSAEILLAPGDRVILDDDSVVSLEVRAARVMPATLLSRRLVQPG